MGNSEFAYREIVEYLKGRASSALKPSGIAVASALLLSQFLFFGGLQVHPVSERSPGGPQERSQIVNWTEPEDGDLDVPLDKTLAIAFVSDNSSWTSYEWAVTPYAGTWQITETWDLHGNLMLEMYHGTPFERCMTYTFNFTFYDALHDPIDYYEFGFITICSFPPPPASPVLQSAVLGGVDKKDIVLAWDLSADDGAGEDDVANYAIYHSENYHWGGQGTNS